jgi:glycerol kinase
MAKYVAAIDQGTTSTRFMIVDHGGNVVSVDQKEHKQIYPRPGWVEHDAREIWDHTQDVITGALERGRIDANEIAAVGVTNQRETTVVWDRNTGSPICNAIVWQDTRTESICRTLALEGGQDRFRAKTGLPLATYFSGPKLNWILENVDGARRRAEKGELLFGTIDTWLIWKLTGLHITDVTNASRTLLMDLRKLDWDDEILELLAIPRGMLPTIGPSSAVFGQISPIQGSALPELPLAGDLGDQQAALFGQTCFSPGEAKNTYGTGCFMLLNTGAEPVPSESGLLTTMAYKIGEQEAVYALEGSVAIAGALVQWIRDNLGLIGQSTEVEALAGSVDDNGGIYFVPAFSGLFAPYWRSDARGAILGITAYTNKGHIARAALEATAFQTREVLDAMEKDSGVRLTALKVDGGMVSNELLMQFQADLLDVPVVRPRIAETTALGAAYAAGLAVGFWENLEELRANWQKDREWRPRISGAQRDELYSDWKKAVTRTFGWVA